MPYALPAMHSWYLYPALALCGTAAGALNVIAGGGSFLTLPLLIFMGLPPTLANGTNRVGILLQNIGAVWGFNRHGVLDWRWAMWGAIPSAAGAVIGTWGALAVGDRAFTRILAGLMIALTLYTLWDPLGKRQGDNTGVRPRPRRLPVAAGFFLVGIYGGFVQAGVGFLVLAATTLGGLDLVRGNAVKVFAILAFTTISLGLFAYNGMVEWSTGLVLAAGTRAGGQLGVKLTVLKGHRWVKGVVTVAVIGFAIKLLLSS